MPRGVPGHRVIAVAVLGGSMLSACTDGHPSGPVAAPPTQSPPATAPASTAPGTQAPTDELTGRSLPAAEQFGAGWSSRPNPGSGHAGHDDAGHEDDESGPATQPRDVADLMRGLVPIGCPEAAVSVRLPRPDGAWERTYAGPSGEPGVALVLQYPATADAEAFLDALERQMRRCPPADTDPRGPLVLQFQAVNRTARTVVGLRQERGSEADPHRYLVLATTAGDRVGLAYLAGRHPRDAQTLSAALRAALRA